MKSKWAYRILIIVILFSFMFPGGLQAVRAQAPQPPEPPEGIPNREACVEGEPCMDENGYWYLPAGSLLDQTNPNELNAIGDSDDYGYTLTSTTYSWIDATDGTNTGITRGGEQKVVTLPFTFPFYENSYTEVYIVGPGYLTFSDQNINSQSEMPDPAEPNNIIAPYWAPLDYTGEGGTGQAFYEFGGTAPNRYLLVEYYQMSDRWGGVFTYEVQIFENGDIKFQNNEIVLGESYWCAEAGIEDSAGMDGVTLSLWCGYPPDSNSAVLFTRPAPSARVKASPLYQGGFSYSGEVDEFIFSVSNTGDFGADTYDMEITLAPGGTLWSAALFSAATGEPLTDTDGDTKIDTGAIPQGSDFNVLVKVTVPAGLTEGAGIKTLIDVTSSLNVSKTKTVTLESTIPAAFAQTYRDYSKNNLLTDLNWSSKQLNVDSAQDHYIYEPAIVETPAHTFVHVWPEYVWGDNDQYGYVLNTAVIDQLGQVIQSATALTSLYGSSDFYTRDQNYSVAVTPDGKTGVLWTRYLQDNSTDLWNYNVWFAVLNPSGGLAYGPVNLTNNNQWGYDPQGGYIGYYQTKIETSADNCFMLAWEIRSYHEPTGIQDSDLYYMIRNSSGSAVTGLINMTADVDNADAYSGLSLTALSGNKFYVRYDRVICDRYCSFYSRYRVINSGGSLVVGENSFFSYNEFCDSIQLPNGNIFFGTGEWDYETGNELAGYAILNGSTYQPLTSGTLSHPSAADVSPSSISVTKTPDGKAIMTWMDSNNRYLYYALFHSSGTVLSGPVISHYFEDRAGVNYYGQSITTNTWQPNSGLDILTEFSSDIYGAAPGGSANIQVHFVNQGLTTAINPSLTLTLANGLTYNDDTSGITPTVVGNTVTWDLPDLAFGDGESFVVYVSVPSDAVIGTLYDIELAITSEGTDVAPGNNSDEAQIMASYQVLLPIVMRQIQ